MNKLISKGIFFGLLLVVSSLWPGCRKDRLAWDPETRLVVEPDSGLTTQIFIFRIDLLNLPTRQQEFYVRWDMDGDANWDGPFSALPNISHRFYQKGMHPVTAEILTEDGKRLIVSRKITVAQGYSAPHAGFSVVPGAGNFQTQFTFDASSTFDDEDSLSTLLFKWDFENDGRWDTDLNSNPEVTHSFKTPREYTVKLYVIDPSQRGASLIKKVEVNRHETLIHVDFTWLPEEATVKDTFLLDASATFHETDPNRIFTYTWDIRGEVKYGPFTEAVFPHVFWEYGKQTVTLTVTDQLGLHNQVTKEFYVIKENKPPRPSIQISTRIGNISTQFYLNAWNSRDDVTPPSQMPVRWDFEGDGIWDTGWSLDKELFYQYTQPGEYWLTLEAEDEGGERDTTKTLILISPHLVQTGYIKDYRDAKYYGTVKIGDQWWMSDNLDYRVDAKRDIPMLQICLYEMAGLCDRFGALYQSERAKGYLLAGKNICPEGWRIPSRSDWEKLAKKVPSAQGRAYMKVGGQLGFNAELNGYGKFHFVYDYTVDPPRIADTVYTFFKIFEEVRFLTTTTRNSLHEQSQYYFGIQNNYDGLNQFWGDLDGYYFVRCIKED